MTNGSSTGHFTSAQQHRFEAAVRTFLTMQAALGDHRDVRGNLGFGWPGVDAQFRHVGGELQITGLDLEEPHLEHWLALEEAIRAWASDDGPTLLRVAGWFVPEMVAAWMRAHADWREEPSCVPDVPGCAFFLADLRPRP